MCFIAFSKFVYAACCMYIRIAVHPVGKHNSINSCYDKDNVNFKHFMKTIKVGVVIYDMDAIRHKMAALMNEYNTYKPDKVITKTRKVRKKCKAQ